MCLRIGGCGRVRTVVLLLGLLAGPAARHEGAAEVPGEVFREPFESGFEEGVALGWTGVAIGSGGLFSENPKTGPIGGSLYGGARCWGGPCEEDVQTIAMSAKVHLVGLGRIDMAGKLRESLGADTVVVLRLDPGAWAREKGVRLLEGDVEGRGRAFADFCYRKSLGASSWPRAWCGLNAPDFEDPETVRRVCLFERAFTERLHELGGRSCVLNLAAGSPAAEENMFLPEVRDLLAEADYFGYHAYGSPESVFMSAEADGDGWALRWRRFRREYEKRGWRFPPVILTEAGLREGWIDRGDRFTPEMVAEDLTTFASRIHGDPGALGLCVFLTGAWPGQDLQTRDITKYPERIIAPIRAWNRAHPVDARSGTGSQVIAGYGEAFDRAICRRIRVAPGGRFRFSGWLKFEFFDGQGAPLGHRAFARIGVDPTGQTDDPDAATVSWSENLLGEVVRETDVFTEVEKEFDSVGAEASIWIRFGQPAAKPSVRLCIDDLEIRGIGP